MYVCMYVCIYIPLQTCGKVSCAQNPCWLMSSEILLTNILGIITNHKWKIPIWGPNSCKVQESAKLMPKSRLCAENLLSPI